LRILPQPVAGLGERQQTDHTIGSIENWLPTLEGDALTLQNAANPAQVYTYYRD